jgi:hypothetical protein
MKKRLSGLLRFVTIIIFALSAVLLWSPPVTAQGGHGPTFGLATPTAGQGAVSADIMTMSLSMMDDLALMSRASVRYGLTPDIMLNFSVPFTLYSGPMDMFVPRTRGGTMMGGFRDLEAMVLWRFHKQFPGVGQRFESTLLLSGLYPTSSERGGVGAGPGMHVAAVTGYASRTVYAWGGAGFQGHTQNGDDQLGNLYYASAVVAWRPPLFDDYPAPDWRIFIEVLGERSQRDVVAGEKRSDTGGDKIFVGPSVLGLYGAWGISLGVLFPLYQDLNGPEHAENARLSMNISLFF